MQSYFSAQNYSTQQIHDVWRRFLTTINAQLTEAFEIERQKGNNVNNQKTLAPHQHVEVAEQKRRQQTVSWQINFLRLF